MPFAVGSSQHADARTAIGETISQLLNSVGTAPQVAAMFVSGAHVRHMDMLLASVTELLAPQCLLGASACGVVAGGREFEEVPAVSVWAGNAKGSFCLRRIEVTRNSDGSLTASDLEPDGAHTAVLLADPYSFPPDVALVDWADRHPEVMVIGGMASLGNGPDGERVACGDVAHRSGASVLLVSGDTEVQPLVSQGCRPIGQPLTVTESNGNRIDTLGNRSPLDRLREIAEQLDDGDRKLLSQGVFMGRVIDEHHSDFGPGDFLIRSVMGGDRESGALIITDEAPVGSTVQFHLRDANSARDDLTKLLADAKPADGALLFTCNGRGRKLYGYPDVDAKTIATSIDSTAIAGMFSAGEIGPIGGRSAIHSFTASAALFRDR